MAQVFKTAVLIKKSRNRGALALVDNWQERKVQLMANCVSYGPIDGPVKDSVPIGPSTKCEKTDVTKDMGRSFKITTGADELILCCPDENTREEWMKAIITIAHDPTPLDKTDDQARLNAEMDKLKLEQANKAAAESSAAAAAAKAAQDTIAAKAKESAEALASHNKKVAEEEAARKRLHAALTSPTECQKKLSTESSFHPRFIWVNMTTKEFHWAKSADDVTKSKCINIMTHIKSITERAIEGAEEPNFVIELVEAAQLPESVFATKLFSSALPTSIDIKMTDAATVKAYVQAIKDIKNPPAPKIDASAALAAAGAALAGAAAGAAAGMAGDALRGVTPSMPTMTPSMPTMTPSMPTMTPSMPTMGSLARSVL